jgi:hypothetical protein
VNRGESRGDGGVKQRVTLRITLVHDKIMGDETEGDFVDNSSA